MTKKTTKHKTTPTQPARLSTYEKKTLAEVDWDLLAEMDAEDEGQPVPMRDNPSTKNPAQGASHSKASEFQIPMGSPNTLFKKQT